MNYVMSDIHGELELLKQMLLSLDLQPSDTLYIIGDAVDRGPNSIATLQYIMSHPNIVFLLGNHEDMMLNLFTDNKKAFLNWIRDCNGGQITLDQYKSLPFYSKLKIRKFLEAAPLYKLITVNQQNFLLVHGGIVPYTDLDIDDMLKNQTRRDLLWLRNDFIQHPCRQDLTVIFGHTFTQSICGEHQIWFAEDKIGIDCGSYVSKKLGCLRLEDFKTFYVEDLTHQKSCS